MDLMLIFIVRICFKCHFTTHIHTYIHFDLNYILIYCSSLSHPSYKAIHSFKESWKPYLTAWALGLE